ncbi:phosphatases II, partial [Patellaria atrata CBS 101060]
YTYRVPTPPRIIIPPPLLNVESNPNIHIGHLVPPQSQNLDLNYLKDIDIKGFIAQRNILDWSYIKRREAQPIMPFIYLGPFSTVKDKGYLQRECITMVLAVRYTHSFYSTTVNAVAKVADEMGIGYDCVDIADNQDLIQKFPQATRIINKHLSDAHARMGDGSLPKVLVFCENGNERSATVVAAYLMEMFPALNHIKAMQVCQAQRFCVNYEDGLKHLLSSYWDILVARRAVAS